MCQRGLDALVLHAKLLNTAGLNKSFRYCLGCDRIVAHSDEIEAHLSVSFARWDLAVVGSEEPVMGAVDRKVWQHHRQTPTLPSQLPDPASSSRT